MPQVQNPKEAERAAKEAERVGKAGTYLMEITGTTTKKERYWLQWVVREGPEDGHSVGDSYDLANPKSGGIFMSRMKKIGVQFDTGGNFDDPIGFYGECDVVQSTGTHGGTFMNIRGVRAVPADVVEAIRKRVEAEREDDEESVPF